MNEDAKPAAETPAPAPLPQPVMARQNRLHLSLVWIVPFVAALAGIVLVVRALPASGPEISIEFRSAEGIEAGRTEVRYKEVRIGRVKRVTLTPDRRKVIVVVNLVKSAAGLAVDDTRFWVVRPRIGTAGVSGLDTLFSGAYIGVDAGQSEESRTEFVGLNTPPLVLRGEPGRSFVLRADDLGSLDVGSPVYHRSVRVGRVVGHALDDNARTVSVKIFIEAPHEMLVTTRSRFWNASGIGVTLDANGLAVQTQSLASVLAGGIAFADGGWDVPWEAPATAMPAAAGQLFTLHASQREAMAPQDGEPLRVRMVFDESLRGLAPGAPVELFGVSVGNVRGVELTGDAKSRSLAIAVVADIYTLRLGRLREQLARPGTDPQDADRQLLDQLVRRGLRARVRTGSLVTGQLYVSLEFVPKAAAVAFDARAALPTLPTLPGLMTELQPRLMEVADRVSRIRFDEIGADAQAALRELKSTGTSLQATLASADKLIQGLDPQARAALADVQKTLGELNRTLAGAQQTLRNADASMLEPQAPLQRSAAQTLLEMQRAANALRQLADYLQRHPESLLRGKATDAPEAPR
jgi:paraquat-inducible protein B